EARIEPDGERVRAQQTRAEPVDGGDPGAVEPACEIVAAAVLQSGPDAGAQLARCLARVGDHEQRLDVEPLLTDRAHEALDEHRRLARPRTGGDEDLARRFDGRVLLGVQGRALTSASPGTSSRGRTTPGSRRPSG